MFRLSPPLLWLGCAGAACLSFVPSTAAAQDTSSYSPSYRGLVPVAPTPYWGYMWNPYSQMLYGVAAVISAEGDFRVRVQEAAMPREQVREKKLENRKKELEQWAWEHDFRYQERKKTLARDREAEYEQMLTDPSVTLILSATALNVLLKHLQEHRGAAAGSVAVEAQWLEHVHVTTPAIGGNVGLLTQDRLPWPRVFRSASFGAERKQVEDLLTKLKRQVSKGESADQDQVIELRKAANRLEIAAAQMLQLLDDDLTLTPSDCVHAKRFVRELRGALALLDSADAVFYLLHTPRGKTVAELIEDMTKHGLTFAPATDGDERQYVALHQALAAECRRNAANP